MKKKVYRTIAVTVFILTSLGLLWFVSKEEVLAPAPVTTFEECVARGNPVMESYPRQCRFGNQIFVESIGNENALSDLIRLHSPRPNQLIASPLVVEGEARGNWFFEASFPVMLTDWDGLIIASGIATAKSDWMTNDFVPFTATLTFKNPTYKNNGSLILKKDNPSGLPEYDNALEIPVLFKTIDNPTMISSGKN
jgi:hypothetical protein